MLNKELCKILNIDEFTQWLIKELDDIEDMLINSKLTSIKRVELESRYRALLAARDTYCDMKKNNKTKNMSATYHNPIELLCAADITNKDDIWVTTIRYILENN